MSVLKLYFNLVFKISETFYSYLVIELYLQNLKSFIINRKLCIKVKIIK